MSERPIIKTKPTPTPSPKPPENTIDPQYPISSAIFKFLLALLLVLVFVALFTDLMGDCFK